MSVASKGQRTPTVHFLHAANHRGKIKTKAAPSHPLKHLGEISREKNQIPIRPPFPPRSALWSMDDIVYMGFVCCWKYSDKWWVIRITIHSLMKFSCRFPGCRSNPTLVSWKQRWRCMYSAPNRTPDQCQCLPRRFLSQVHQKTSFPGFVWWLADLSWTGFWKQLFLEVKSCSASFSICIYLRCLL